MDSKRKSVLLDFFLAHYRLIGWTVLGIAVLGSTVGVVFVKYLIYRNDVQHSTQATGIIENYKCGSMYFFGCPTGASFFYTDYPVVSYKTSDGQTVTATLQEDENAIPAAPLQGAIAIWYRSDDPQRIHFDGSINWIGLAWDFIMFWILIFLITIILKIYSLFKKRKQTTQGAPREI